VKASLAIKRVLSRSVSDSAALLDATQGADPGTPYAAPLPARPYWVEVATAPGRLRIAFGRKPLFGRQVQAACIAALEDGARRLDSLGRQLEEAAAPVDREACAMAFITVLAGGVRAKIQAVARLACSSPAGSAATPSCSACPASWSWFDRVPPGF
jgi:amidase